MCLSECICVCVYECICVCASIGGRGGSVCLLSVCLSLCLSVSKCMDLVNVSHHMLEYFILMCRADHVYSFIIPLYSASRQWKFSVWINEQVLLAMK